MAKIEGIERLEGRGIKARVIDVGKLYSTYWRFAREAGYPEAVDEGLSGRGKVVKLGKAVEETFKVLAKGNHSNRSDILYVIQDESGERYIIGGEGIELIYPENISEM